MFYESENLVCVGIPNILHVLMVVVFMQGKGGPYCEFMVNELGEL